MEHQRREFDDWETLVEKAVEIEANVGLQRASLIRKMDHRCLRENRPAHTTSSKVQNQRTSMKDPRDPRTEESKPKKSQGSNNSGNSSGNSGNSFAKKRIWGNRDQKKDSALTTPTAGANASQTAGYARLAPGGQKKKQRRKSQGLRKDISEITYDNCNKKSHYSRDCTEPKN